MRAAERGEDELSRIRLPRGHLEARAALVYLADGIEVAEVQSRVDAVRVEIQGDRDDIQVSRALSVAKERPLHPVGPGEKRELRRGDAGSAVIVGVERDDCGVAARQMGAHPLDLVGVDVGGGVFHGRREIEDDPVVGCRAPHVGHGLADLERELELGAGEALRGILKPQAGSRNDERAGVPA